GVSLAARYLAWLAEHADYPLSDIEAEVAAQATGEAASGPGEPADEAEPGADQPDDNSDAGENEPERDSDGPDQAHAENSQAPPPASVPARTPPRAGTGAGWHVPAKRRAKRPSVQDVASACGRQCARRRRDAGAGTGHADRATLRDPRVHLAVLVPDRGRVPHPL